MFDAASLWDTLIEDLIIFLLIYGVLSSVEIFSSRFVVLVVSVEWANSLLLKFELQCSFFTLSLIVISPVLPCSVGNILLPYSFSLFPLTGCPYFMSIQRRICVRFLFAFRSLPLTTFMKWKRPNMSSPCIVRMFSSHAIILPHVHSIYTHVSFHERTIQSIENTSHGYLGILLMACTILEKKVPQMWILDGYFAIKNWVYLIKVLFQLW